MDRRIIWRVVVPIAVIVGGVLSVISTDGLFGSCKTEILSTVPSPDGGRSVVIFRKQCAAAVPYSTQASIAPSGIASPADKIPAFFIISGDAHGYRRLARKQRDRSDLCGGWREGVPKAGQRRRHQDRL